MFSFCPFKHINFTSLADDLVLSVADALLNREHTVLNRAYCFKKWNRLEHFVYMLIELLGY